MFLSSEPYLSGAIDVYKTLLPASLHRMNSLDQMIPAPRTPQRTRYGRLPSLRSEKSPTRVNPLPIELKAEILQKLPPPMRAQLSLVDRAWCEATRFFTQRLSLKNPDDLVDALTTFPHAVDITFEQCHNLTGAHLQHLANNCTQLQRLRIHDTPDLNDRDISSIATMKNLQSLSISGTAITDKVFESISHLPGLTHLHISGEHITGSSLNQLSPIAKLQSLNLEYTGISSHTLGLLPPSQTLKEISLEGCRALKNADLSELSRFPMLENLNLDDIHIADDGMANLANLTQLHTLSAAANTCTSRGLESIGKCQALTSLDLSRSTNFDAEDVRHLTNLHHLQFLDLGACGIDDNAVNHLLALPQLQRLSLLGSSISTANYSRLAKLKNLNYLVLAATDVSNSGVLPFMYIQKLRYLALYDCPNIDLHALAARTRNLPDLWVDVRELQE